MGYGSSPFFIGSEDLHFPRKPAFSPPGTESSSVFLQRRVREPSVPHETVGTCGAVANRLDRRCYLGQIYPVPAGFLKQPTDSGSTCLGSQSTTSGKKMQNAITAKKTT
jgi:hypothetical protein